MDAKDLHKTPILSLAVSITKLSTSAPSGDVVRLLLLLQSYQKNVNISLVALPLKICKYRYCNSCLRFEREIKWSVPSRTGNARVGNTTILHFFPPSKYKQFIDGIRMDSELISNIFSAK